MKLAHCSFTPPHLSQVTTFHKVFLATFYICVLPSPAHHASSLLHPLYNHCNSPVMQMSCRRHVMSENILYHQINQFPCLSAAHTQSASTTCSISSAWILIWWLSGTGTSTETWGWGAWRETVLSGQCPRLLKGNADTNHGKQWGRVSDQFDMYIVHPYHTSWSHISSCL